jgi:hypothetical protein
MNEHHIDARISIHAREGRIRVPMPDEVVEVSAGELVAVNYAISHDIEAIEESAFLLMISWPGGTTEERHAWEQACLDSARHKLILPALFLLLPLLLSSSIHCRAQNTGGQNTANPKGLAKSVVANELKSEQQDHSHWSFLLNTRKPQGQTEVDEVVQTKDGDLKRPVLINGHKLNSEQQQKADKGIQQLVQNPVPLQQARKQEDQDTARSQRLLKMLPDAFNFSYGRRRGDLIELKFSPNPNFHPPSHEAKVFHAMEGSLWVNDKQQRVEEISGRLMHDVKFGEGLLGYLEQGGTFDVKQSPVVPDYWEMTLLKVQMKGKALFFKTISVQQNYTRSEFKQVPDDLTVAKAAEMLQKETATE